MGPGWARRWVEGAGGFRWFAESTGYSHPSQQDASPMQKASRRPEGQGHRALSLSPPGMWLCHGATRGCGEVGGLAEMGHRAAPREHQQVCPAESLSPGLSLARSALFILLRGRVSRGHRGDTLEATRFPHPRGWLNFFRPYMARFKGWGCKGLLWPPRPAESLQRQCSAILISALLFLSSL